MIKDPQEMAGLFLNIPTAAASVPLVALRQVADKKGKLFIPTNPNKDILLAYES